jgi:hypothetical protein
MDDSFDIAQVLDRMVDWYDRNVWLLRVGSAALIGFIAYSLMTEPVAASLPQHEPVNLNLVQVAGDVAVTPTSQSVATYAVTYECKTGTAGRVVTDSPMLHVAVMGVFTGLLSPEDFSTKMTAISPDDGEFAKNFLTACMGIE